MFFAPVTLYDWYLAVTDRVSYYYNFDNSEIINIYKIIIINMGFSMAFKFNFASTVVQQSTSKMMLTYAESIMSDNVEFTTTNFQTLNTKINDGKRCRGDVSQVKKKKRMIHLKT